MMKKKNNYGHLFFVALLFCAIAVIGLLYYRIPQENQTPSIKKNTAMLLLSPAFENNGAIPKKYTCDGYGINPELRIEGAPEGTKSFALIMDDPDAPRGTFTHWTVWNIDPRTTLIKEESVPPGSVEGINGANKEEYIGPCPPSGTHHYHFVLYALSQMLDLLAGSDRVSLEAELVKYVVAKAELVGTYAR